MSWASITQSAIKLVTDGINAIKDKSDKKKLKEQLRCHNLDLQDVIYKTDHDVPNANLTGLGDIRGFVEEKRAKLAQRTLVPTDIRNSGNAVCSASLEKIDACRKRLQHAA